MCLRCILCLPRKKNQMLKLCNNENYRGPEHTEHFCFSLCSSVDPVVGIKIIPVPNRSPNFLPPALCTYPACFLSALAIPPPARVPACGCCQLMSGRVMKAGRGGAAIAFKIILIISKDKKYIAFTSNLISIGTL